MGLLYLCPQAHGAEDEIVVIKLDSFAIAELLRVTQISASAPDDTNLCPSTGW